MASNWMSRAGAALAGVAVAIGLALAAPAGADPGQGASLPVFVPHPSDWAPDTSVYPYNLWQSRTNDEQVTALRDSCQWFNAQYDTLMSSVYGFQNYLRDHHDVWAASGSETVGTVVTANLDQSAAFLDPRVHALYITNYPDQSQYSPLYNGDSFYHLWFQFTQISDKIKQQLPSGVINANIATANVYGNTIRDSGICDGA
ncbi:Uncharacterised protein [Mycobacteroides abscessus]|uniref:Secreted protein n=3 Tax=Mycobacteroides abscessus TaxID=36809 RepID=A0A829HZ47_9MYCO|nr:hypothetical protein [Mycobacteroides abscessus]ESV58466.1 hypothetical protein L830_4310 [Mycobacteroides abscessus MAB_082312_2258]ESV61853.1 hypothetical protein L833_4250 [Mycobacteroides abscessus MAB_091912_2446]AIC72858.1 hypothetical protein MYCMA_12395 [Mycobacteroides abscessus subsp. massiliense str. GO 06]AMU24721.1 hypothetical protein A3N96_04260 [Mycobacteroides abscessus]AMU34450.1 hypothetical protein A3N98_03725 [Mycobacteroides abscessus]